MLIKRARHLRAIAGVCNRLLNSFENQWELLTWRRVALHDEAERDRRDHAVTRVHKARLGRKASAAKLDRKAKPASKVLRGNCRRSKR